LGKVLFAAFLLRLTGLTWGLPAADGWDDDGVAPRDFLIGVVETFSPGHYFTYPPLHLLLLATATAPVWVATLVHAPSLAAESVVHAFIQVPTMTALAIVARLITICLSLGLLWSVAKIGEELGGSARTGCWVAAACGANSAFTYYSQTSNLDLPYLFWSVLSLRWLVTAIARRQARLLRRATLLAALAVATKDQAYALFLIGMPLSVATWLIADRSMSGRTGEVLRELAIGAAIALVVLLAIDGAFVNPSGFARRLRFLLGTASQDHAYYARTWAGRLYALRDTVLAFSRYYPLAFAPFVLAGILVVTRAGDTARRVAGLVPLLFAISVTVTFNMAARRSEHRFVLPQALMWGVYAGIAFDALHARLASAHARVFWGAAVACFGLALFGCLAIDAAMILDPRYDAEDWMRVHVRPGESVEIYGNNTHLPRLPSSAVLTRVDVTPLARRNPLPGVTEVVDQLSAVESRRPHFIVVSEFWAARYLFEPERLTRGHVPTQEQVELENDDDSRSYYRALRGGHLRYRFAHVSDYHSRIWPRLDVHASLGCPIWIFQRIESSSDGPSGPGGFGQGDPEDDGDDQIGDGRGKRDSRQAEYAHQQSIEGGVERAVE
jgi:hypothetical protein